MYSLRILLLIVLLGVLQNSFAQKKKSFDKIQKQKGKDVDTVPPLSTWTLEDGYLKRIQPFDTVLPRFHIYDPIEKTNLSATYLGNVGSEYVSNIFFNNLNKPYSDFLPDNQFETYLSTSQKQQFYFAPKPYAELKYFMTTKKWNENDLHVLYTQNINPKFNYGIKYDLQSADGIYPQSKVSEQTLNFFIGYSGDRYSIYAAYIRNKFRLQESGGIKVTGITDPNLTQARIEGAYTQLYKLDFFVSQEFKFGYTTTEVVDDTLERKTYHPIGKLNYIFNYDHNYHTHFDDDTTSEVYRDNLISETWTTDSTNLKKWENSLFWTFNNISYEHAEVLNSVGALSEIIKNYQFKGYVWKPESDVYHNLKVIFKSEGTFKKFLYRFNSYYYLIGYKTNDFRGTLNLQRNFTFKKSPASLALTIDVYRQEPALMEQYYYTNHFIWDNNFDKKDVAQLNLSFTIPKRYFKLKLDAANLGNYVYFDSLAYPAQMKNTFNVFSAAIEKEFNFGKFSSMNRVIWQYADNDNAVSIPEYVVYHSLYFNVWYKTAAHFHIGYEIYYSAEFDALSYAPVTGQFYLGQEMKSGGEPIFNMYMDIRVQRVTLFFKYENVSFQFFTDDFYYLASYYPMNPTLFKFGVAWRFTN